MNCDIAYRHLGLILRTDDARQIATQTLQRTLRLSEGAGRSNGCLPPISSRQCPESG